MMIDETEVQKSIREFIDSVGDTKIEKYHNDDIKAAYKAFFDDVFEKVKPLCKKSSEVKQKVEVIKKLKKEKGQSDLEFFNIKYKTITYEIKNNNLLKSVEQLGNEFEKLIASLEKRNKYEKWIEWALNNGRGIYLATHIAKLSHSSCKSSSIDYRYYEGSIKSKEGYVSTQVDESLNIDRAYTDNALSSIASFYYLLVGDYFIGDLFRRDAFPYLKVFTSSEEKSKKWAELFRSYIREDKKNSHFLSKQVYFPVNEDKYHLLLPLVSSSMAHVLHLKFQEFFDENSRQAREQRKINKYYPEEMVSFPNRANLKVTQSNHSNASSLNGKRAGRLTLLPSTPPKWTGKQTLPRHQANLFDRNMGYKLCEEIKELQDLLRVIKAKEAGLKKPEMYRAIVKNVNLIAQALFDEITKINMLSEQKGWTEDSDFSTHQQLLLEPDREDEAALAEKNNKQWLERIADDFSAWLNAQLKHKTLNLTPVQQRLWKDIFFPVLREYIAIQEAKQ
ncbi:type I-F CRISPR-associated protein Csy1 [Methylotuvimicrobium sp. KM1]|uniref:type I-F CRISPR-associated protein Csy1 n=1 Tax=Methylotuvimicrobium sp. KM1 TaxID=3377707 RepID=UPI00384C5747